MSQLNGDREHSHSHCAIAIFLGALAQDVRHGLPVVLRKNKHGIYMEAVPLVGWDYCPPSFNSKSRCFDALGYPLALSTGIELLDH